MTVETRRSYCRFCHAACAIDVDVDIDTNRAIAVRGVKDDPVFAGYTCIKGRHLPQQHNHPDRLRSALKSDGAGGFTSVPSTVALDDIAARVATLIETHGPRSIATYCGTAAFQNATALPVARAFHQAIGSPSFYTSITIDQPAKSIAPLRHGAWLAGTHSFRTADVVMTFGNNTLVSSYGWPGTVPCFNPFIELRDAKRRGMFLIVVDPRRTEMAEHADLHLPVRPGEDPTLLAAMVRLIIDEALIDHEFVDRHVDGVDELRRAVDAFDLDYAARRSGVDAGLIEEATRRFAAGPRGCASTGTGPNMSPHPSMSEHLVGALNILCGRFNRAGETVENPGGVLTPATPIKAQVARPRPDALRKGPAARVRDLVGMRGEGPTAALPDEILLPGDGQVRALFTTGGNPVVAWPDQIKTIAALKSLDLHVAIDVQISATAQLAHYVLASELCLERPDVPITVDRWFEAAYGVYTPAVLRPDGDVLAEWRVYTEVAARLGVTLHLAGGEIAPGAELTSDDVLDLVYVGSKVPLATLRAQLGGALYPELATIVAPADPDATARFELAPDGVDAELAAILTEGVGGASIDGFDPERHRFRMSSRRLKSVFNSSGREIEELRRREQTSFAHIHPDDLAELGAVDGQIVELASPRGTIRAIVKASDDLARGTVSMAHAWGGVPHEGMDLATFGDTTSRLIDNASGFDPFTGMAAQSGIPVEVRPVPAIV